jgi:hypothetical protein
VPVQKLACCPKPGPGYFPMTLEALGDNQKSDNSLAQRKCAHSRTCHGKLMSAKSLEVRCCQPCVQRRGCRTSAKFRARKYRNSIEHLDDIFNILGTQ